MAGPSILAALAAVAPSPPSFAPSWCKGANPQFATLPWGLYNGGKISPQFSRPKQIGFEFNPRLHQGSDILSLSESVGWNANLFMVATGDYTCEKTCQTVNGQKQCGAYLNGECNMQVRCPVSIPRPLAYSPALPTILAPVANTVTQSSHDRDPLARSVMPASAPSAATAWRSTSSRPSRRATL